MTTKRYTVQELENAARAAELVSGDSGGWSMMAKMLKQAAEDCEDAEKFRALTRCMDSITVEFSGLSMTIKPAPKAHVLLSAIIQGAINATDGIDLARTQEQAK